MNFKERVAADIKHVFLNPDVFGEAVCINGAEMVVVFDEGFVNPADTKMRMGDVSKKIAVYDLHFHVAADQFEYLPPVDEMMELDGILYRIKKVVDNMGMLTIGLSRVDG